MIKLSKADQERLAWEFYEDANLRFIYSTFKAFVESRVGGEYTIDIHTSKTENKNDK